MRISIPLLIITAWVVLACGTYVLPLHPDDLWLSKILATPDGQAWLGYDDLGRPVAARVIMGARTSLYVAFCVTLLSLITGTCFGILAAWCGGWWDRLAVLVIDVFIAFPGILLAIALAGLLGPGIMNAVIALSVVGWVGFARLARAQTLTVKQRDHVTAAISLGSNTLYILVRHLLPLILAPLIVEATFAIAGTVLAEAGLSFLGLGVQPPQASWGSMIRDGTRFMLVAPHMVLAPGLAVFLVVLAVNLSGDALRDKMDVRLRERT
jgi:peptide/nickel transport system permease protein